MRGQTAECCLHRRLVLRKPKREPGHPQDATTKSPKAAPMREEWKKVGKKKGRVKTTRPDALMVRGSDELSYADIFRTV